jgi:hypothetical protein
MRQLIYISFLLFYNCSCLARDLFSLDEHVILNPPLQTIQKEYLFFIGSVVGNNESVAFLEDHLGNVHKVRIGQVIGSERNKVIKILSDAIFLSNGQQFSIIRGKRCHIGIKQRTVSE